MFRVDQHKDTAEEFLGCFLDRDFCTNDVHSDSAIGQNGYIFRGLADSEYQNIASAFRTPNRLVGYAPQTSTGIRTLRKLGDDALVMYMLYKLTEELKAIEIFTESADQLGIPTSLDYNLLKRAYQNTFSFLAEEMPAKQQLAKIGSEEFPDTLLLEAFALAQHHGVPTRLLDWTESFFVAAFFAAYGASSAVPIRRRKTGKNMYLLSAH